MNIEKEIKICGFDVKMRYCAAAERNYEEITSRPIGTFVPTFGKDDEGKEVVIEPAKANTNDFIMLSFGAILAAYNREKKDPPISLDTILYESTPSEFTELIKTVVELRAAWYKVPEIVGKDEHQNDGEGEGAPKNA